LGASKISHERLTFLIALVYFLNEVPELVKQARFVEVYYFIIDPLWKSEVFFSVECFVVVLKK